MLVELNMPFFLPTCLTTSEPSPASTNLTDFHSNSAEFPHGCLLSEYILTMKNGLGDLGGRYSRTIVSRLSVRVRQASQEDLEMRMPPAR